MQYFAFLTTFFLLLCSTVHSETVTTTAGMSTVGTSTIGTQTSTPKTTDISISPTDIVVSAGESIQFTVLAIDEKGNPSTFYYSTSGGSISSEGVFTATKAGTVIISVIGNGMLATAKVIVVPAVPAKLAVQVPDIVYGQIYQLAGLIPYQVLDAYDNEIVVDQESAKSTIKKNTSGNLLGRLISSGGSANSPYVQTLKPVLVNGYVFEQGNIIFFERGTYTVTVKYGDVIGTKEFAVNFKDEYRDVEAWVDYHMGIVDLDNRFVTIKYDIGEGIEKVIPLRGDTYDKFYDAGLICKFFAICYGHYEILSIRQALLESYSKKVINKAFMGLIQPKAVDK